MCRDPSMKQVVFTTILLLCLPFCLRVTEGSSSFLYTAGPTTLGYVRSWLGTTLSYPTSFPLFSSSSSAAGSSSSFKSSSSYTSGFSSGGCDQHDKPFKTLIKDTDHGRLGKTDVEIEIYLNHKEPHWFLLAKPKKSSLSLITFEITSCEMNLIRQMRFYDSLEGSERVGIYSGSFTQLCDFADDVITEMRTYNFFTRNCQHFCNKLLARLGLRHDFPTSFCTSGFSSSSCDQHDKPFKTMIKYTDYGPLAKADVLIEIYLNRKGYHWFLLAKFKKSSFSLISFEITSSNMGYNLIRYMRFNESLEGSERVGIYSGSFMQLCGIADGVITKMGSYNVFKRNCQHFCNNLLARLGLRHDYPTTIGPTTTISESYTATAEADNDKFIHPTRLEEVYQTLFSDRGGIVGTALVANMLTAPKLGKNVF